MQLAALGALFALLGALPVRVCAFHSQEAFEAIQALQLDDADSNFGDSDAHTQADADAVPRWACDLAGWVRAPDLSPNAVLAAEARLVVNGSECRRDIVGWGVGLRFKERAFLKRKKPSPAGAETADRAPRAAPTAGFVYGGPDELFDDGLDIFTDDDIGLPGFMSGIRRDFKDRGLWDVRGAERKVFDTTHELPLHADMWLDDEWLDAVHPFAVHVPNTNFPPLLKPATIRVSYTSSGSVGGMTDTEDLCEYYLRVSLANGSTVDVPAGRAAFVPRAEPVAAHAPEVRGPAWPKEYKFTSPRADEDPKFGILSRIPECDEGNLAEFSISVDYRSPEPIVQGTNITLHATLRRTGNGSEVPHSIFFTHTTHRNYTWARAHVDSAKEYDDLETSGGHSFLPQGADAMLMATPQAVLDDAHRRRADFNDPSIYKKSIKHKFDAAERDAERIEFEVELPIAYDDMITFERTFVSFQSMLDIMLLTQFTCAPDPNAPPSPASEAEAAVRERNKGWMEHVPIPPKRDEFLEFPNGQRQTGSIRFDVRSAVPATKEKVLHYLDPTALAPRLTLANEHGEINFAPLGSVVRPETEDELLRARYAQRSLSGWRAFRGGANKHAAKVWAYAEAVKAGLPVWERDESEERQQWFWRP